jgi:Phosphotransferase enzyme family
VSSGLDGRDWPAQFRPVLAKLVADGRSFFGVEPLGVEPLRQLERPFSTLLQIRVARPFGAQDAFVKILKPRADTPAQIASMRQNVVKDFEMTSRVHDGLAAYPGLTAVRPIACFPEDLAIVTEEAPGPTLADLLARAVRAWPDARLERDLEAIMRQVGAWLRAVQAALPDGREVSIDAMRAYLDTRLDDLERTGPRRLTRDGRSAIERFRDRLIAEHGGGSARAVWIHADFCPENIIARGGMVTVLDFTMAKSGTVYHDLSHLYLRLDSMKVRPWCRASLVHRLQSALLDAFEPGLEPGRPLFALMLLQHVVCHLVALQAPSPGIAGRLSAYRHHKRHRAWLAEVAGLTDGSWVR